MHTSTNFQIYNASAGSGKTFTLVKEYLKILLSTGANFDIYRFQKILAITFTNKATEEMKTRILKQLKILANGLDRDYTQALIDQLGDKYDAERIRLNAKEAYSLIIHNYSRFEVSTIDSFFIIFSFKHLKFIRLVAKSQFY